MADRPRRPSEARVPCLGAKCGRGRGRRDGPCRGCGRFATQVRKACRSRSTRVGVSAEAPGPTPCAGVSPSPRARSRPRPASGCGLGTGARCSPGSARRRGRMGAGDGTRARRSQCSVDPGRRRNGNGRRRARTPPAGPRPGRGVTRRRVDPGRHLPRSVPRGLRPAEPLRLEPLELLGDGQFDDRGQVAIGHRRPHERLQALQLVAEPGPGGELDLVAGGGEGLHARRPRPCGSHRGDMAGRVGELLRSLGPGLGRPPLASRRSGDDLTVDGVRVIESRWLNSVQTELGVGPGGSVRVMSEGGPGGCPTVRQLPDHRQGVRPGRDLGDQLLDLALGPVRGAAEQRLAILRGQVGRQLRDGAQVEASVAQHREKHRMLACGAGDGDAQVRLELGEVERLRTVDEHRGRGLAGVEPAGIHFTDVGDEVGLDAARVAQELGQATEQLVVGNRVQGARVFHAHNIGGRFSTSLDRACSTQWPAHAFGAPTASARPVARRRARGSHS